jgi:cell division protein FtsW
VKRPTLHLQGDRVIWILVVFLSLISLLAVYSSTRTMAFNQQGGGGFYMIKHVGIILFGLGLMYAAHLIPYPVYSRISKILLPVAILLLIYTAFKGVSTNEARRWVIIPIINLTFQTSDFAKLALTIFLARSITLHQDELREGNSSFLRLLFPIIFVCVLILPSNFSTAAILFTSSIVLLYVGRARIKHILMLGLAGIVGVALFIGILYMLPEGKQGRIYTWKERINDFAGGDKNQEDVYQARQSKIAIASGGIIGKFPGNSTQRNYLPNPFSDFIYAIIIEEYGLLGGILIILIYLALLFRSIKAATGSPGTFGSLLAIGLGFNLVFQAMINMAVASGLLPVTGQPLPLISMGGTSIWFTSISIGIILSVSKSSELSESQGTQDNQEEPYHETFQTI